jgi:thymidylate synthase ThyX
MSEKVHPDVVFSDETGTWERYNPETVGITAITYNSKDTGATLATLHGNPNQRVASHIAWAGARHSRAPGDTIEILLEMGEKGVDPDQKLEDTFKGYGHASVADMARIAVQFNNVPMHVPMNLFNETVINSGQEKSTRYQKQFSGAILHPLRLYLQNPSEELSREYEELGKLSLEHFNAEKPIITQAYEEFFKPIDKKEKSSLDSRVLDTIRFNLLLGQSTGFALETSARDWARIVSCMKASDMLFYRNLGQQIETMLAPSAEVEKELNFKAEAPSLIRHTEADDTLKKNLLALKKYIGPELGGKFNERHDTINAYSQDVAYLDGKEYTIAEKMVAQYLAAAYPGSNSFTVLYDAKHAYPGMRDKISEIIFNSHTHQKEMPTQLATTSEMTVQFNGTLGELRDFNRHRAWGRFLQHAPLYHAPALSKTDFDKVLFNGFGLPLYVSDIPEFDHLDKVMTENLEKYYAKVVEFGEKVHKEYGDDVNYYFMMNLLPLAHKSSIWMHGDIKQADYLVNLRIRPGGHINYRQLAYDAGIKIAESDPYLSAMKPTVPRPDPANREEFFGRS